LICLKRSSACGVARVAVGVVLERQLSVGGLDGLGVGVARDVEDVVEVGHRAPVYVPVAEPP
jgi:hypothetical protein